MAGALKLVGRGAAVVAALLLGWASVGSALDRATMATPGLAQAVPAPLRARAYRADTIDAIQRKDSAAAIRNASAFVRADPLDAGSSALLGAALQIDKQPEAANAAFRVSGALGWRDAITQAYWAEVALALGDNRVAAERIDALLRVHAASDAAQNLVATLESRPEGRTSLVQRLGERPPWLKNYVAGSGELAPPALAQRIATLRAFSGGRIRIDCAWLVSPVTKMFQAGQIADAAALWFSACTDPRDAGALVRDSGFDRGSLSEISAPFEWALAAEGGLEVERRPAPEGMRGQALFVRSSGSAGKPVAAQTLLLAPGRYRARVVTGTAVANRVEIRMHCLPEIVAVPFEAMGSDRIFAVPNGQGCIAQQVFLLARPGTEELAIDAVDLVRE